MPCHRVCVDPVPPAHPHCPCMPNVAYANPEGLRKQWEIWDLRVLTIYILYIELFLLFFGRHRRKSYPRLIMNMNIWLLYLLVELLAVISLGKLSNAKDPNLLLRGLWAPIIFFYLGGPDTITVLRLEENDMWMRHLIGFFGQGIRTVYVLYATWTFSPLSLLAMLMLFSGLIKYGERVWVIRSRVRTANQEGFVQSDESTKASSHLAAPSGVSDTVLVLKAYSYFQTLSPHKFSNVSNRKEHAELVQNFHAWIGGEDFTVENAFKLIEIELGFTYDMLFSKINTVFDVWGFIFRFISFSCVVTVLVWFLLIKSRHENLKGDFVVTTILLAGAICLEIGGVLVQISSDWAIIWTCKHHVALLVTPISRFHKLVNQNRKRWSEFMGQFNLLDICVSEYKLTMFEQMVDFIYGKETALNNKFALKPCRVEQHLKEIIFNHLREIVQKNPSQVEALEAPTLKRGMNSLETNQCAEEMVEKNVSQVELEASILKRGMGSLEKNPRVEEFKWRIEPEFVESITIWHIVTDICYHSKEDKSDDDEIIEETKKLSSYMMHLLHRCRHSFRICNTYDNFILARGDLTNFFEKIGSKSSKGEAQKELLREQTAGDSTIAKIQKLAEDLLGRSREERWKIMSNVWVEMLCYAASNCPVKNHVQQLNNGGELLTHVWLLMLHLGVGKTVEEYSLPPNSRATAEFKTETRKSIMENIREYATCCTEDPAND